MAHKADADVVALQAERAAAVVEQSGVAVNAQRDRNAQLTAEANLLALKNRVPSGRTTDADLQAQECRVDNARKLVAFDQQLTAWLQQKVGVLDAEISGLKTLADLSRTAGRGAICSPAQTVRSVMPPPLPERPKPPALAACATPGAQALGKPVAVLDLPGAVKAGRGFSLSGARSFSADRSPLLRYMWTIDGQEKSIGNSSWIVGARRRGACTSSSSSSISSFKRRTWR